MTAVTESKNESVLASINGGSSSFRKLKHLPVFFQRQQPEFEKIFETVDAMPLDDTHCHLVTDRDAITSPKRFLERISLAGYPFPAYFPPGGLRALA